MAWKSHPGKQFVYLRTSFHEPNFINQWLAVCKPPHILSSHPVCITGSHNLYNATASALYNSEVRVALSMCICHYLLYITAPCLRALMMPPVYLLVDADRASVILTFSGTCPCQTPYSFSSCGSTLSGRASKSKFQIKRATISRMLR